LTKPKRHSSSLEKSQLNHCSELIFSKQNFFLKYKVSPPTRIGCIFTDLVVRSG
jgi:hypothetical protein